MNEYDADEPVAPLNPPPRRRRVSGRSDRVLAGVGILLAAAAAAFPWYVFFNEDKFGIRVAGWEQLRDLPEGSAARNVFSVSPLAMPDRDDSGPDLAQQQTVDPVVTATVSQLGAEKDEGAALAEEQPYPGRGGFRLLHVANGRALIEDRSGMYMVQIGSILPDNSRLATIEHRDGRWVIVTSSGEVYSGQP